MNRFRKEEIAAAKASLSDSVAKANAFLTAVLIEDLKAMFLCLLASAISTLFLADLIFAILYSFPFDL